MLQQDTPDDFVIATGITHSVRDFVIAAFASAGINDWERYIETDTRFLRPAEVDYLIGDASKAHQQLGWRPRITFDELVSMMVENDLQLVKQGKKA
ncbi:MAG TPA: GDP-mannose 4,6-dehydratase, partial [Ktedonobacteraceae bacterium]|nr:GDP-mannose 4,6-dehydratase [Ktedonobacteraceae bacterium]